MNNTTRISHTGHNHPATPAARAACRAYLADALAELIRTRQDVLALRNGGNSRARLSASSAYFAAATLYAAKTGLSKDDVTALVATHVGN